METLNERSTVSEQEGSGKRFRDALIANWIPVLLTVIVVVAAVLVVVFNWEDAHGLELNELGDAVAGLMAAVGLIWVVAGFYLQARELRDNTAAVEANAELIEKEIDVRNRALEQAVREWGTEIRRAVPDIRSGSTTSSQGEWSRQLATIGEGSFIAPVSLLPVGVWWNPSSLRAGTLVARSEFSRGENKVWFAIRANNGEWFASCCQSRTMTLSGLRIGPLTWVSRSSSSVLAVAGFPTERFDRLLYIHDRIAVGRYTLEDVKKFASDLDRVNE